MRTTSERTIKFRIKAVLDKYRSCCYYFMPVPGGYGRQTLDYLGFVCGKGFAIEAKRSDGKPTPRQEVTIAQIGAAGVPVFVIKDEDSLDVFKNWIREQVDGPDRRAHRRPVRGVDV